MSHDEASNLAGAIAIIGMSGRFPGASNVDAFWENLAAGVETVSHFTDEELEYSVADAESLQAGVKFVKARSVLEDADRFDAAFFGIYPKDAETMDPQHRVFLECAWEAFENAGYDPEKYPGLIGVFAGASINSYLLYNLAHHREFVARMAGEYQVGEYQTILGNDKDYLPTRVSYKLNLRGPSMAVQSACSTSLVAVCQAIQNLQTFQCDMALAGGVSISFPQKRDYRFTDEGMVSRDGHCRPFDASAQGTVFGNGAGVVLMKRLADAVADGDTILAVIRGAAVNNDGGVKMGYTAPSSEGQAEAITLAMAIAGVDPETISCVEAHGTGTPLGDPIEIAGLTKAFRAQTDKRNFCALTTAKGHIGHLEIAAGVTGLIKTVLSLRHRLIPPILNFNAPNPRIDFAASPFYVNTTLREWATSPGVPRRAGVSSFGVGGTNAHVIVEEAPGSATSPPAPIRPRELLVLSARSEAALNAASANLAAHFEKNPGAGLADTAFTLQAGRRAFAHRRVLVASNASDAAAQLRSPDARQVFTGTAPSRTPALAFLFPGQGAQSVDMGRDLYRGEAAFRAEVDRCAEILQQHLGLDLRHTLYPEESDRKQAEEQINQTWLTQPSIFVVEYALARLWLSWGLQPSVLVGHSIGEYVCAVLAGSLTLEDALALLAARARLMQALPAGSMLAVRLSSAELEDLLPEGASIAAINSPSLCTVAGPTPLLESFLSQFEARKIAARFLATSHAFHSAMMDPLLDPFTALVAKTPRRAPQIPWVSTCTGQWITAQDMEDAGYWARQLRQTVLFADALGKVLEKDAATVLLEVGPGQSLTQLAAQHPARSKGTLNLATLGPGAPDRDYSALLSSLGRLWLAGFQPDWPATHAPHSRHRVPLPTYPFERQRFWVDAPPQDRTSVPAIQSGAARSESIEKPAEPPVRATESATAKTPVPADQTAPAAGVASRLRALIQELSGVTVPNETTSFVELGFDSLFLVNLITVIQKRFGVRVALLDLFDDLDSPGALAAHLEKHSVPSKLPSADPAPKAESAPPPVKETPATPVYPAAPQGPVPITEAQREIWLACQRGPLASAAFNESCIIHFRGDFKIDTMRRAIQTVVDRHDTLRTVFSRNGDTQSVQPELQIHVPVEDLSALASAERERRLLALQQAEGPRQFDLTRGPLFAASIIKLSPDHHALIFTAHHIACDGWSFDVILRELGLIYTACCEGRPDGLPPAMQMSAYQRWEEEQQRSATFAADRTYWLERFKALPPPHDLPGDRPRPPQRSHAGSREFTMIPGDLYREIARTGLKLGVTPFAVLLTAFQTLLFRLSGERDFVVGVPAAGQNLAGGANLVGHCVNLLAQRATIEGDEPFADFLKVTRNGLLNAFEHQRFNFGQLVRHLSLSRDPSRVPLIGITFNLNPPQTDIRYNGLRHEIEVNPRAAYQFDLSFNCYERHGDLRVDCDFNTDLFDAATIQRWLAHYRTLLAAIVAAPETSLSRLPLITPIERAALIELGRGPANSFPADVPLAELFRRRAGSQPDATAIIDGGQRFTYAEVERRADQVANHLLSLGLKPGQFVGLRSVRSARFIWEAVGVLRAGGAYVPVAEDEPAERMKLIEETCSQLLLTAEAYAAAATAPVELPVDPAGPAYLLFTSGSTGIPKGVVVPHHAVTRLVWNTNYVEFRPDDVVAFASNLNFDAVTFEIWGALLLGGALAVTSRDVLLSPATLEAHLAAHGVTILFLTTSLFNRTAQALPALFRSLRYMVFGGEAANAESVRLVLEKGKPAHLVNGYGPTEATTFAVCHDVEHVDGAFIPIGRPIANTSAFILDTHGEPVPRGVAGEIYLGGPGLALGYHHDAPLTAERFPQTEWGRLYRTGDLARWRLDDTIEYLGRRDQQIKLRGFRIEPGEIETALKQLPSIHDAAVVLRMDNGDPHLVAYCVRRQGVAVAPENSGPSEALRAKLPKFMIPAAFVDLDHLPLTANGKLDRAALPAPSVAPPQAHEIVPPTNSLQAQLIEIWEEVLQRKPIGIRDDFFAIGGHSLLAAQVIALITARLGHELPFAEFFADPTIENHSRALLRQQVAVRQVPYALINPEGKQTPVFFFHGDFVGGGFFCKTLASVIGADRPFYALHPHGLQGDRVPLTIEEMATDRLRQIREIQPRGPYIIGGYCNGALTAFQAARLLVAAGEEVSALLMLIADGSNVRFNWLKRTVAISSAIRGEDEIENQRRFLRSQRRLSDFESIGTYYVRAAADLLKQRPREQFVRLWRKAGRILSRPLRTGANALTNKTSPLESPINGASLPGPLGAAYADACGAYIPLHYEGSMTLLWPRDEPEPPRGPATGWEKVCSQISVVEVPGHHHSCISVNANVVQVGHAMRIAIEQAESLTKTTAS